MNIFLITFGSHDNYIEAGERLVKQAEKLNIFTKTILYTPEYLIKDIDFKNKHNDFLNNNKRGYGYWLWKPFIIKKTMENMKNGDILLYLDGGCELSCNRKGKLLECIDVVKNDKIVGAGPIYNEKQWCKMDLIELLDMKHDCYLNKPHREAGIILLLVCNETRDLVNEWYNLGCDYHNIDDSPSINKNLNIFVENYLKNIIYLVNII